MKPKKRRVSKSYRTFLFKKRMTEIIHLLLCASNKNCYFCGKPFTVEDFPIDKPDKLEIHHVTYIPEYKVLAHKKCHRKFHADQKKSGKKQKS